MRGDEDVSREPFLEMPLPTSLNHALEKRFHCLVGIPPSSQVKKYRRPDPVGDIPTSPSVWHLKLNKLSDKYQGASHHILSRKIPVK